MLESFRVSAEQTVQSAATRLFMCWAFAVSYFAMIVMVSPLILKDVVGADDAAMWQGRLASITGASGLVLCAALGYASDRWGRLFFIRLWAVCFFLASVAVVYAEATRTMTGLIVSRIVPFSVASALTYALAADIARDTSEVLKAHTALGATFSSAMLVGNLIAAVLGFMFGRIAVLVTGSLCMLVSVYLAFNHLSAGAGGQQQQHQLTSSQRAAAAEQQLAASGREDLYSAAHDAKIGVAHNINGNSNVYSNNSGDESSGLVTPALRGDDAVWRGSPAPPSLNSNYGNHNYCSEQYNNNPHHGATPSAVEATGMDALRLLQKDPLLRNLVVAFALLRCANVNSFLVWVLFVNLRFEWGLHEMSAYLIGLGLLGAAMQALFVRYSNGLATPGSEVTTASKMAGSTAAAGVKVRRLFFGLMVLAILLCIAYGAAPTSAWMYALTVPGGIVAILPAMFTSKIASLSREANLTGFCLGFVGSLQNFFEIFLGVMFGRLLQIAIRNYEPTSWQYGLPYYANAILYTLVCVIVVYSHFAHGTTRELWMEHAVDFDATAAAREREREALAGEQRDGNVSTQQQQQQQ